jgi:hypothetical protein
VLRGGKGLAWRPHIFQEQRKGSRARQVASSKITDSKIAEDEDEGRGFLEE